MGDLDAVLPIEGDSRQKNPIDPITAVVVLTVAFVATLLGLIPWATKQ